MQEKSRLINDQSTPIFTIGKLLYSKWRYPDKTGINDNDFWFEPWLIRKITNKFVFTYNFRSCHDIRLKRNLLERFGYAISYKHELVFYTDMPEWYKKLTIEHLMNVEPRQILNLPDNFTQQELRDRYHDLAMKTHPDRNPGDQDAHNRFMKISEAYNRLLT